VHIWRRSYDVPPPKDKTALNPDGVSESLKDTAARTLPYWTRRSSRRFWPAKNVIVVAHGNSLRSIVMQLDKLTREQVLELNIRQVLLYCMFSMKKGLFWNINTFDFSGGNQYTHIRFNQNICEF